MKQHKVLITLLQNHLDEVSTPKTRQWWEKYMRQVIPFRGAGIPEIRQVLAQWRKESGIDTWPPNQQLEMALELFTEPVAEDKLAGILFLQEYLYDQFPWPDLLKKYETIYKQNLIFDWNTCDWFCVRVLGPTIRQHGVPCARAISSWKKSKNLWQARSSVVAFVKVAKDSCYYPYIRDAAAVLILRPERFAKTGVGWILRDIPKYDKNFVDEFVEEFLPFFPGKA